MQQLLTQFIEKKTLEKTFRIIQCYVLKNNGNFSDAEDIFQEGFKIFNERILDKDFILTTTPENFVIRVCQKLWLKELHRRKIQSIKYTDFCFQENYFNEPLEVYQRKEKLYSIVERNIEKLKPRSIEIFQLKRKGLSLKEIATLMGLKNSQIAKDKFYREKKKLIELIFEDTEYQKLLKDEYE